MVYLSPRPVGGLVSVVLAGLLLAACTTTTDPRECQRAGLGCNPRAVEQETDRLASERDERLRELAALRERNVEAQAREAALQRRFNELNAELVREERSVRSLRAQLDQQLAQNRISRERYNELSEELRGVTQRIAEYRSRPITDEARANEASGFLRTQVVQVRQRINQVRL